MKRTALRKAILNIPIACLTAFYALVVLGLVAAGGGRSGYIWVVVYTVILVFAVSSLYRLNVDQAHRDAERDLRQAEYDEKLERMAQENDILTADHRAFMESLTTGAAHVRDPRAVEIRERRDREYAETDRVEREARQARIVARSMQQIG